MKTSNKLHFALTLGLTSLAASALAGPIVTVQVPAPTVVVAPAPPPAVVVQPAPAVTVATTVPDSYVYDGTEYVGVIGTQYYYLGPDKVWLPFDSVRETRFHTWEGAHADWRSHMVHNEIYRHDARVRDDHHDEHHDDHDHH